MNTKTRIGKTVVAVKDDGKPTVLNIFTDLKKYVWGEDQNRYMSLKVRNEWKVSDYNYGAIFARAYEFEYDVPHIWGYYKVKGRPSAVSALVVSLWHWEWDEWVKYCQERSAIQISYYTAAIPPKPKVEINYEYLNFPQYQTKVDSSGKVYQVRVPVTSEEE